MKSILVAAAGLLLAVPAAADAQTKYLVTYAARSCPEYTDVYANLARNDIQESLRDLGADSPYTAGEAVTPRKEIPGQPRCRPLVNWRFVLGTGYASRAVTGPWGSLSKVTGAYDTPIVTQASTPALDPGGNPTGFDLAGAVTVELTPDQVQRAGASNSLWVQGGAVDDPVLDQVYPGQYGFAAVRCAIDDLNGDNVEWIGFPQGTRHVYCFAYYVTPPPTSGTIVIRKVVDDPAVTASQDFRFTGNLSYSADHSFTLSAANGRDASQSFIRAAGEAPWTVQEELPPGWSLTGLSCASATGASSATTDAGTGAAAVRLGAGDTVTCTYTNRLTPPAGLLLAKRTLGGVGSFEFRVAGKGATTQTITTRRPGVAAVGKPLTGAAGTYAISETAPPRSPQGRWVATGVNCGGRALNPLRPLSLTVSAGKGVVCLFTNRFVPAGALVVRKTTVGSTGTANFQITRDRDPSQTYSQRATTRKPLLPVPASGDRTSSLPLGSYTITEFGRQVRLRGYWRLDAVLCNGRPVGASMGTAKVRLTAAEPKADCTFINEFVRRTPPQPGPTPTPTPTPTPNPNPNPSPTPVPTVDPDVDGPTADLVVTKRVAPATAAPGDPITYTIRVVNRGPDAANDVVVAEVRPRGTTPLKLRPSQGSCAGDRPVRCALGTLGVGDSATITATVAAGAPGRHANHVAAVTSTRDPRLANNAARATVTVSRRAAPGVTG
ncbi:MAG TPA: DUF11 domain-containing protein [Solirubrobacter sp.]|nr:DUF11 domain-containing protein [Solirubrobacter sp.]